MPPSPSELVLQRLAEGTATSAELEQLLGQSQSQVSRLLRELIRRDSVVRIGSTRGARYARLRSVEGVGGRWPLRRVGDDGHVHDLGVLHALAGTEFYFESASGDFEWAGVTDGLPYFLLDPRPAGFLGRGVPQRFPELALPQRVADWSDDHYLRYLTQRGSDSVSDLVLGDAALDDYLSLTRRRTRVAAAERERRFPQLVSEVMEGALPGSSAHGEHPKFAVLLDDGAASRHVLIKFSPPVATAVGQRWSDLLVTECIAQQVLAADGIEAARSRIHKFADRTYLEVDRFDRSGVEGRVGVSSLYAIDSSLYGKLDNWTESAARLARDRRIDAATLGSVRLVNTFGSLIANTDRHFGNLAFFDHYDGRFRLAPVYDMLPMLYAPEHDQLPARSFAPPDPSSANLREYGRARALAEQFWRNCAQDERISEAFRRICAASLASLEALPRTGAYLAS
ncbi:MAG: type II toxin-antitoxin system HipA family toxin YjjJ [Pseudomonadota bacterium]